MNTNKQTGEETMNESYKDKFNAQMKKAGIDSLGDLKTDAEKKAFFKAVDKSHDAKNEGGPGSGPQKTNFKPLSRNHSAARMTVSTSKAKQIKSWLADNGEKYPVSISDNGSGQITIDDDGEKGSSFGAGQAIAKKFGIKVMGESKDESMTEELLSIAEGMKEGGPGSGPQPTKMKPGAGIRGGSAADGGQTDDEADEYDSQIDSQMMKEMMKEMASEMKMLKAETDPTKVEMMKKEMMMKAMKKMPEMSEMMKKEMMKQMDEYGSMNAMKEDLEEKHVPGHNDTPEMTVGEIYAQAITKMNAMRKTRTTEMMNTTKTDEFDMAPNPEKLTAMIKDPMKSKEEDPKRDLNATYMKSDVRADVKNGGGADMSKVQDAPKMMAAMKKISAMYKTEKYHETKPGSIHDAVAQMQMNEQKSVSVKVQEFSSLVETYLAKGGVVGNISEAVKQVELNKSLRMNDLREFITTYNLHFLTN